MKTNFEIIDLKVSTQFPNECKIADVRKVNTARAVPCHTKIGLVHWKQENFLFVCEKWENNCLMLYSVIKQ